MSGVVRCLLVATLALSLTSCQDSPTPPRPEAACVASEDVDHTDLTSGDAAWARFCDVELEPGSQDAVSLVPSGVLTEVDAFVAAWSGSVRDGERMFGCGVHRGCPEGVTSSEQQATGVFSALWSALAADDSVNQATMPCPRAPTPLPENERIDDNDGAVLDTRAIGGAVCDYVGRRPLKVFLTPKRAEELRYLVSTDLDVSGQRVGTWEGRGKEGVVFVPDPDRQPRLVGLVSARGQVQWFSMTGAQHRVTLRDAETGRERNLGKAGESLLEYLRDVTETDRR